ncbi:MAG: DegT/DnrJ/EryC1/StrS family aminotransferase [Pseudomonadota bacterium]
MIPMVDLRGQYESLREEIEPAILEALGATQYILGPNVQAFEQEAAEWLGVRHAITCASGTDALHLALDAADIGPGDEVITSPFTFIATAEAIRYVGATPVFVDIEPAGFNIDPAAVEAAITPNTRAILPVHLFGQPADMGALMPIAEKHGLKVVEDCAQSFGADIDGTMTGRFGIAGAFSFFPSKNLGCYGDGGMITTDDDAVADRIRMLRNHGSSERYYHDVVGYNSRLDELQAVILRIKLKRMRGYNEGRRRAAHLYSELLADVPGVTPPPETGGTHVYHQYTLRVEKREAIQQALQEAGAASAVYYPVPLHQQKAFAEECRGVRLPVTEQAAAEVLSLPMFPELSKEQIHSIVDAIRAAA